MASWPLSVSSASLAALCRQDAISFRPPVAEELPYLADFLNHIQVEVRHQHFVFVAAGLGKNLAPRIAKVTLAVKLANAPGFLFTHTVDGADKITVGDGMRRLLQFPQVFGKSSHGGRWIENDFRSVQSEGAGPLGKVPVVTDVHPDLGILGLEHGIPQVPRREV